MSRIVSIKWLFPVVALGLTLVGCAQSPPPALTYGDVRAKYRERYAEFSRHLALVADKLPPAGSVKKDSSPVTLDPRPGYDFEGEHSNNTGFLSVEELRKPEVSPEVPLDPPGANYPRNNFNVLVSGSTDYTLISDSDRVLKGFETGLALRYLVVYRVAELDRPSESVDRTGRTSLPSFTPGSLKLEVFLVDLKTDKVVASFPVSATTSKYLEVSASGSSNADPSKRLENAAMNNMGDAALSQIAANLNKIAGGKFRISK